MSQTEADFILLTQLLSKGFTAVDDVNLNITRGHTHAVFEPNGSSKTTIFNLLTKFLLPSPGKTLFNNQDTILLDPATIVRLGAIFSFQMPTISPNFSVLNNIHIVLQRKEKNSLHFWISEKVLNKLNDKHLNFSLIINSGLTLKITIIVGIVTGCLLGVIFGKLAIKYEKNYFAMVTLALMQLMLFLCLQASFNGKEEALRAISYAKAFDLIDLTVNQTKYYFVLVIFLARF